MGLFSVKLVLNVPYTAILRSYSQLQRTNISNMRGHVQLFRKYEGWNFNSGNYLFTTDTK